MTLFQWAMTIVGIVVAVTVLRAFWSRDRYGGDGSGASGGGFFDGSGDGDSGGDGGGGD